MVENKRANIKQRQAEGIAAAKVKEIKFGRKSLPLPDNFSHVCNMWKIKRILLQEAARQCGMSKSTFYGKAKMDESH